MVGVLWSRCAGVSNEFLWISNSSIGGTVRDLKILTVNEGSVLESP